MMVEDGEWLMKEEGDRKRLIRELEDVGDLQLLARVFSMNIR